MSVPPDLRRYPELEGKTFLVGIGGMKCATSWVFQYLEGLPGVSVSAVKEMHFFSEKFRQPWREPMTPLIVKRARDYLTSAADAEAELAANPHFRASVDRLKMIYDDSAYFDHFAGLVSPETKLLCEITPRYALIGADGFEWMKGFFATQGVALRLLLILRDPVDRLWSQLRHDQQLGKSGDAVADWEERVRVRSVLERADYRRTVRELDAVFPAGSILYLFYEDLFDGDGLEQLCTFAGLACEPPARTDRRNETAVKTRLPDDIRNALRHLLDPQYEFCRERFGPRVPGSWLQ